jgi:hypothetical protein
VQQRPKYNLELIKRVLDKDYIEMHLDKLVVDEDSDETRSKVHLEMSDANGAKISVDGEGVGLVDAIFNALLECYGLEYQSIKSIEVVAFRVEARLDTKTDKAGVDSMGCVTLGVHNSEGKLFEFSDESRSISRSSARAMLAAVEYFVNAERAFITLHRARMDAKERRRDDLVVRYTRELAEVVKSTSYADVIENMKRDL